MSEISAISASLRDRAGKGAARATRRAGLVPGVIYGAKKDAQCIAIDPRVIWAELKKPGFSSRLFDIELGAEAKERCLARDVQFHPVSGQPVHIDFLRVSADSQLHVKISVHCINQEKSPGLKRGGVLSLEHHEIDVVCSAANIPSSIEIDLSGLEIGAAIHVGQLALPEGVRAHHLPAEATVVIIAPPTVAQGDVAADAATAAAASAVTPSA